MSQLGQARRRRFEAKMHEALVAEGYNPESVPSVIERGSDGDYRSIRVAGAWFGFNAALDSEVMSEDDPCTDRPPMPGDAYIAFGHAMNSGDTTIEQLVKMAFDCGLILSFSVEPDPNQSLDLEFAPD